MPNEKLESLTDSTSTSNSRWKCPHCGSPDVQIGLPAWHTESKDFEVRYVETDLEADIMWWYCPNCDESGSGQPEDTVL